MAGVSSLPCRSFRSPARPDKLRSLFRRHRTSLAAARQFTAHDPRAASNWRRACWPEFSVTMLAVGGTAFIAPVWLTFALAEHHPEYLAIALWGMFAFWQLYPVIGSMASVPFEFATLLRFPMSFSTYWWLAFLYGLDRSRLLGVPTLGLRDARRHRRGIAVNAARRGACSALFCAGKYFPFSRGQSLARTMAGEAQVTRNHGSAFSVRDRRLPVPGPLCARLEIHPHRRARSITSLRHSLGIFSAGTRELCDSAIRRRDALEGLWPLAPVLLAYSALLALLLNNRLRAQFLGENLSEAMAPVAIADPGKLREGWDLRGLSGPVAAIFEKETRYLLRSAPVFIHVRHAHRDSRSLPRQPGRGRAQETRF